MGESRADVVIVGGAVMGSAAAWWLSRLSDGRLSVVVVERDPGYGRSSTALSVASVRQQFTQAINVRISRFGIDFIKNVRDYIGLEGIPDKLDLRENGYLLLAGSARAEAVMRRAAAMQRAEGAATELLPPAALADRFPQLSLDGVRLGSFGPRDEGWFDNMGLLQAFRRGALAAGVRYVKETVVALERSGRAVSAVRMASGDRIACGAVVNAAGTRAAEVMQMADQDLPVEARKRTVFLIDAPNAAGIADAPLLVDHTGFYLRPEGRGWITAAVPEDDPPVDPEDFEPDHHHFEEVIWPRLYARVPAFDAVKVTGVWAGHYAFNRFDQNAILGPMPEVGNLYAMNGFSGHGLQQAPAMGRAIAELIVAGGFRTLDLTPMSPARIVENRPLVEDAII